ncbi:MAG: methylated-DNA--[protein]-cysteine S-methyltransferase, partial [Thermodesulfobacteriota bacterium]
LKEFQTKLDLSSGTPFQISVWGELLKIPYGTVTTYGEIAKRVGNPDGARAVGNAVGANPLPIIVPCHRVVASNGLGGYSGGMEIKKSLLRTEGILQ